MEASDAALRRLVDQVATGHHMKAPLDIRGGGTKSFYGGNPRGEPLDTRALAGISSYEPTELVVTARAGTPLAELEAVLAEKGQVLAFEPPHFGPGSTVGGMVAAGLSGPSRVAAGGLRNHVLGVTMLNGRGEVLTFGGQVMKNVAGYDVSRLMAGSMGVLGVICEVSLKVLPAAQCTTSLSFDADEVQALGLLSEWTNQPLPLNAAAWAAGRLVVRLAGAQGAVSAATHRMGGSVTPEPEASSWWEDLREHRHAFFTLSGDELARGLSMWRVCVPNATVPLGLPGECWLDWAGTQRWVRADAPASAIRAAAAAAGGHATLFRGADKSAGVFAPLSAPLMKIHRSLKQAFDPAGIFNPGRLFADL